MVKTLVAFAAFVAVTLSSPAHAEMELSKYPRAYKGGEGLVVKVVSLKGEKKQALIEFTGVDTEIDGVVFLADQADDGKALSITLHGEPYWPLRSEESWYGWKQMNAYLPEMVTKAVHLYYDEKESKQVDAAKLLATHKKQTKDGTIKELAKWNRPARELRNNENFAKEAQFAAKKCDMQVPATIAWKSVTDDHLKELSISGYCDAPLTAMRRLCERSDKNKKAAVKSKVKKVVCTFGPAMKLVLGADGTLQWTTSKDASNADDFATNNLDNLL